MTEGLNVEVAHKLTEHEHSSARSDRVHEIFEIIEVVMLAVVAVATAWTGFQAAKWDGEQSVLYGEASSNRFAADAASTLGGQKLVADSAMLNGWLEAHAANDTELQDIFVRRFTPDYRVAFDAWLAADPFGNPATPPGPAAMPEYHNPDFAQAEQLNEKAAHEFEEGTHARETAEKYVFNTVMLASVLFLIALAQRAKSRPTRIGATVIALAMLGYVVVAAWGLPARDPVDNDLSPLADTEVHYVQSAPVGAEFKIFVGHCGTTEVGPPPAVLYLTDANGFFGAAVDLVRSLQLSQHLPPLLVVGIGYRAGGLGDTIPQRTRDLTPTSHGAYAALFPDLAVMGGAAALFAFVQTELMPWVAARYEIDRTDAAYFGHSLGGLWGCFVLTQAPTTFRRYIIGSPSLWWHRGVIFDLEEQYAREHRDLPAKVFFGIGGDETQDGRIREVANLPPEERAITTTWHIDMVEGMVRFVERLRGRGYPSLALRSAVFADEFHITVPLLTMARGLRYVFDAPR